MRNVRCRECGSPEVPTLATCPACGIKTEIDSPRPWALLAAVLVLGAVVGAGVGRLAFPGPRADAGDNGGGRSPGVPPRDITRGDAALQRKIDELNRKNEALSRQLTDLAQRPWPTPPTAPVATTDVRSDGKLRPAHVRWLLAYAAVARAWQAPYLPMAHLKQLDVAALETLTRELSSAASAAPEGASWLPEGAVAEFTKRLDALRQALGRAQQTQVDARADWKECDLQVAAGDLVYVSAQGAWRMTAAQAPEEGAPVAAEPAALVGAAPLGALLWRVRGSDAIHAAMPGSGDGAGSVAAVVEAAGPIEFRINEQVVQDNSGAVTADVIVLPKTVVSPLDEAGKKLVGG